MTAPMYRMRVNITIEQHPHAGSDRLTVSEDVELDTATFMETAGVLARFHELTEKLRQGVTTACTDCGADPGQWHAQGCDRVRCPISGGQRLTCNGHHERACPDVRHEVQA